MKILSTLESLSATKSGILNDLSSTKVSYSGYNKSLEIRVLIFVCYQLGDDFGLVSVYVCVGCVIFEMGWRTLSLRG